MCMVITEISCTNGYRFIERGRTEYLPTRQRIDGKGARGVEDTVQNTVSALKDKHIFAQKKKMLSNVHEVTHGICRCVKNADNVL